MNNSCITNDDLRCVPRHRMSELYDLDDLHWLGIYYNDVESETYRDSEDENG